MTTRYQVMKQLPLAMLLALATATLAGCDPDRESSDAMADEDITTTAPSTPATPPGDMPPPPNDTGIPPESEEARPSPDTDQPPSPTEPGEEPPPPPGN